MKKKPSIEAHNAAAHDDALRFGLPQYWLLITPVECYALLDGVVSSRIKDACGILHRDIVNDYPAETPS